jgi:hypothetical protein
MSLSPLRTSPMFCCGKHAIRRVIQDSAKSAGRTCNAARCCGEVSMKLIATRRPPNHGPRRREAKRSVNNSPRGLGVVDCPVFPTIGAIFGCPCIRSDAGSHPPSADMCPSRWFIPGSDAVLKVHTSCTLVPLSPSISSASNHPRLAVGNVMGKHSEFVVV